VGSGINANAEQRAAVDATPQIPASKPMKRYIGSPISRIDGRAKSYRRSEICGGIQCPRPDPRQRRHFVHRQGRIKRIDTSAAMGVEGVLTVLTHENRPPLADTDESYKDDVAPDGSPFRPLYDSKIMFNLQPVALVVAESSEAAQFATSLVLVEYEEEAHVTDIYRQREAAVPPKAPSNPFETLFASPKTRGAPDQALAAAAVRHEAEYFIPIEHHNPMELFASTVVYEKDGKLTIYDKTQGLQNVHGYVCRVFSMKPETCA
jgi:xanthine dehydrogenase YagR molybdenum-binding subunit